MDHLSPQQIDALAKEDRGPTSKSIVIAFTIIAFVCVVLRMFTRLRFTGRAIGWEDSTILISMVCSLVAGVFQVLREYQDKASLWSVLTSSRGERRQWQARHIHTYA